MDIDRIERQLASIYRGSPWIVIVDASAAASTSVAQLQEWGVERILVVSASEGVGAQPEDVEIHHTGSVGSTIMGGLRAFAESLASDQVADVIDAFDPGHTARILAPPFGVEDALLHRRSYGVRKREWMSLEDKIVIDRHFHLAGIETAPHAVVDLASASRAARDLATKAGSVWVADNREGWHGGGEYVRWVRNAQDEQAALDWFGHHADKVRVMPFLDGLPCSIHGFVTEHGVAAFRPVEMLIARRSDASGFRYLGMATTWDPDPEQRELMRDAAKRMGAYLDGLVGYRGPFSIDGVMTQAGFRPTELNPRMSAGFGIQAAAVPDLRGGLFTRALIEGDIDIDPGELEEVIVQAADRDRAVRIGIPFGEAREKDSVLIEMTQDVVRRAAEGAGHGTLDIGPAPAGSYALLKPEQEHVPRGVSVAPLAVATARLAADEWNLHIEDIEPALEA